MEDYSCEGWQMVKRNRGNTAFVSLPLGSIENVRVNSQEASIYTLPGTMSYVD